MAVYEYRCRKCARKFTVTHGMAEHGTVRVRCPKCASLRVAQQFSGFFAKTARKS